MEIMNSVKLEGEEVEKISMCSMWQISKYGSRHIKIQKMCEML